jgi:hypothetical protein
MIARILCYHVGCDRRNSNLAIKSFLAMNFDELVQILAQTHRSLQRQAIDEIQRLAKPGQPLKSPRDAIKDPYILEFLELEQRPSYSENELETAIINKLEHFLLELGKGFLTGHPFDSSNSSKYSPLTGNELSKHLRGIDGKSKSNAILQIADLCLYPVARNKDRPGDRAYLALQESSILVDSRLPTDKVGSQGIKYYCFDNNP